MQSAHDTQAQPDTEVIVRAFVDSRYTGARYAMWSIEDRLDAFLVHRGLLAVVCDEIAYQAVRTTALRRMRSSSAG